MLAGSPVVERSDPPVVDVCFPLYADRDGMVPVDHGYALLSSLSRIVPAIHGNSSVGVHPIDGPLMGNREMRVGPSSNLVIRLPASLVPMVIPLSGASLQLEGCMLTVGVPSTRGLVGAASVSSRLVTIKHATTADSFLTAVKGQLAALNIEASPSIPARRARDAHPLAAGRDSLVRRTIRIAGREVVGYALIVGGLSAEDSVRLQENGIGGRRRFGCGVFVPTRALQ